MPTTRISKRSRRVWWGGAPILLVAALALPMLGLPHGAARADDRDLLRFDTAKPYLMILLDTSASMNLAMGDGDLRTEGHGDDPASRIYGAKEALYEVFESSTDFHFGFVSYNQDQAVVLTKHWLYYSIDEPGGGWPLDWPTPDPDGLTVLIDTLTIDTDGDGVDDMGDGIPDTVVNDVEGDVQVLGSHFQTGVPGVAGECGLPLDLDDPLGRDRANAFAKTGALGGETTRLWVASGGIEYLLEVSRPGQAPDGSGNGTPGDAKVHLDLDLSEVISCTGDDGGPELGSTVGANVAFFLDPNLDEFLMVDDLGDPEEETARLWDWQDASTPTVCQTGGPFSGNGWEGNYDSGIMVGDPELDPFVTDVDPFCVDPSDPATCVEVKPVQETQVSAFGRPLDRGDLLPFDWANQNKSDFLRRLAPDFADGTPDFRISPYFQDTPGGLGVLELVDERRKPLVAMGRSALGDAILDIRCWYQGTEGSGGNNKCRDAPFAGESWGQVACTFDSEFGCRRPYLIVISDGDNNCQGENPAADTASLFSHSGVRTWSINLGDLDNCSRSRQGNVLKRIAENGGGECVNVSNTEELKLVLQEILGQIREESRTFASAAVPSVQATADQIIYVSRFTPLNDVAFWDGHVDAFLKPLPLDENGRPDIADPNHLWDAGDVLAAEQVNPLDPLGPRLDQRRVYYGRRPDGDGTWTGHRRLFDPTSVASDEAVRYDLWRGMDLISEDVADGSLSEVEELALEGRANAVIANTLALRTAVLDETGETIQYALGDIFHSTPLVLGTPVNDRYFALDLGADQDEECAADDSVPGANRGYRCFVQRQRFRRKVLAVGANDGMLHAFAAGTLDRSSGRYDSGTGNEIWAWVPRAVQPTLRELALPDATHRFTVDGSSVAADAFVDPRHTGTPDPAERLWRTVLVGSLREGGPGYFALDVTQPDPIERDGDEYFPAETPAYLPECIDGGSGCGPVPYPSPLWEFGDTTDDQRLASGRPAVPVAMDEDANGYPDLAASWSVPTIGRILLCDGEVCDPAAVPNDLRDVYVAVFGGGIDGETKQLGLSGEWIYIVDLETGHTLYKRQLDGAVPMSPAAVDTDQDAYLDRIYVGTVAGSMYRIDLGADAAGEYAGLSGVTVTDLEGGIHLAERVQLDSLGGVAWEPRRIFDASFDGGAPSDLPRPLYQQPAVLNVGRLGLWALAFGSGDREDLWSTALPPDAEPEDEPQQGRFYVVVDDSDLLSDASLPLTEAALEPVLVAETVVTDDYLLDRGVGQRGWFLQLDPDERTVTDAFALSGITVFSTFLPDLALTDADGDPVDGGGTCSDPKWQGDTENRCSKTGTSRIFVLDTTNGNPFLLDPLGDLTRYLEVSTFVTDPYTESGQNKGADGGDGDGDDDGQTADDLTEQELRVMESLQALFPEGCRFSNFRVDIKTISADTRIQRIAAVPVCIIEKNWREF